MEIIIKVLKKEVRSRGFNSAPKVPDNCLHSFYCEALWHDQETDEETLVELWKIKIDKRKFTSTEVRQSIVAGLIYCFLETPEAANRGINRVFFWNNKSGAYEPLGAVSDNPFNPGESSTIEIEADPIKAYENIKKLCVDVNVVRMNDDL